MAKSAFKNMYCISPLVYTIPTKVLGAILCTETILVPLNHKELIAVCRSVHKMAPLTGSKLSYPLNKFFFFFFTVLNKIFDRKLDCEMPVTFYHFRWYSASIVAMLIFLRTYKKHIDLLHH